MEKTTLADKYLTFSEESEKLLNSELVESMTDTFNKVYPAICDFFNDGEIRNVVFDPDPNFDLPPSLIVITDDDDGSMIANNLIKFNPNDVICQEGIWSVDWMTHELVHVAQNYKYGNSGNYPHWIVEGLADYGGAKFVGLYKKEADWFIPKVTGNKDKKLYLHGYRWAAGFFLWIEENIDEALPKDLNNTIKSGKYTDNYFAEKTGSTLDELWVMYLDASTLKHFAWIEEKFNIKVPEKLNDRIINGQIDDTDDNYFIEKTGKTFDELWEIYTESSR